MKAKVTIKDVAKHAGVSTSTVSRVVSRKGKISEETTLKVKESIRTLGYVPNYSARSLVSSSTDTIAVLVDRSPKSLNNSYFTEVLQAISDELTMHNKELLLTFSKDNQEEKRRVKNLIETNRIDGVIKLTVRENDLTTKYLIKNKVPSVVIGNPEQKDEILWVDNDNEQAMFEVVDSLIKDGHQKMCFVGGAAKFIVTKDRLAGFKKAHDKHGLKFDEADIYYVDFSKEDAYRNADKIISKGYDAIVCIDDAIAMGIYKRADERRIKVKVTGFNNSNEIQFLGYPISTVDIRTDLLGRSAVKLLLAALDGKQTQDSKIIKTEFIKK